MLRNSTSKSLSILQKTYDESYLTCSTAVYYENQGNEDEALRCWRAALAQIEEHHATKILSNHRPRSDAEKALIDSIGQLELQCKERIDLLQALRISRAESGHQANERAVASSSTAETARGGSGKGGDHEDVRGSPLDRDRCTGYIGDGTIPAITYTQLSRPALGPHRPPLPPRTPSSDPGASGNGSRDPSLDISCTTTAGSQDGGAGGQSLADDQLPSASRKWTRSPSPPAGKHVMRTTLRTGAGRSSKDKTSRESSSRPGANQAASLAWNTLTASAREKTARPGVVDPVPSGSSSSTSVQWDSHSRRLVDSKEGASAGKPSSEPRKSDGGAARPYSEPRMSDGGAARPYSDPRKSDGGAGRPYPEPRMSEDSGRPSLLSVSAASSALHSSSANDLSDPGRPPPSRPDALSRVKTAPLPPARPTRPSKQVSSAGLDTAESQGEKRASILELPVRRKPVSGHSRADSGRSISTPVHPAAHNGNHQRHDTTSSASRRRESQSGRADSVSSSDERWSGRQASHGHIESSSTRKTRTGGRRRGRRNHDDHYSGSASEGDASGDRDADGATEEVAEDETPLGIWRRKMAHVLRHLPPGVDVSAARQILNEIVVQGDDVRWSDIAGLEPAKAALREAVVYPFLRPDLFRGLREPARGLLLFGPPGTGKTMLARAVATESKSTFFSISASSLTSKYLGESEKLVRALFALARMLAPSIIFVDEIDGLLGSRAGSAGGGGGGGASEHEASRRIKTEFLICWSDLQRAAAGREPDSSVKSTPSRATPVISPTASERAVLGDRNMSSSYGGDDRVLVLAATNLPWAIDEAARRRFVRRQYIPLPEPETRRRLLTMLLARLQSHALTDTDIEYLVEKTDGFSGSDITALAKDAAMGPLRSLGERLLLMSTDEIRPVDRSDFDASLCSIRPSVSRAGLQQYEEWAREFGERAG